MGGTQITGSLLFSCWSMGRYYPNPIFLPFIKLHGGKGAKISFWTDCWIDRAPLIFLPSAVHHLSQKNCPVSAFFFIPDNWNFHFRRDLREDEICECHLYYPYWKECLLSPITLIIDLGPLSLGSILCPTSLPWPASLFALQKRLVPLMESCMGPNPNLDRVQKIFPHLSLSPIICVLCYSYSGTTTIYFFIGWLLRECGNIFFGWLI